MEIFSIPFSAHAKHKLLSRNRSLFLAFEGRRFVDFGTQYNTKKQDKTWFFWHLPKSKPLTSALWSHCSISDLPLPKHCWNVFALLDEEGEVKPAAGETVKPRLCFWISLFWVLTLNYYMAVLRGLETTEFTKIDIDPCLRSFIVDRLHFVSKRLKKYWLFSMEVSKGPTRKKENTSTSKL